MADDIRVKAPKQGNMWLQAQPVRRAVGKLGKVDRQDVDFKQASVQAFGDYSGQEAMANAFNNVSEAIMDVAQRNRAMDEERDNTKYKQLKTDMGLAEGETRAAIDKQIKEGELTVDEAGPLYTTTMQDTQNQILDSYQFKTYKDETVQKDFDATREKYQMEFVSGKLEGYKWEDSKGTELKEIQNYVTNAALAGYDNKLPQLSATIDELTQKSTEATFRLKFGARSDSIIMKAKQEALLEFARGFSQQYPQDMRKMVDGPEMEAVFEANPELIIVKDSILQLADQQETKLRSEYDRNSRDAAYSVRTQYYKTGEMPTDYDILNNGSLRDQEKNATIEFFRSERKSQEKGVATSQIVQEYEDTGRTFEHLTPEKHRKLADDWWAGIEASGKQHFGVTQMNEEQMVMLAQANLPTMKKTKLVPSPIRSMINGWMSGDDKERAMIAYGMYETLVSGSPELGEVFTESAERFATAAREGQTFDEIQMNLTRGKDLTKEDRKFYFERADIDSDDIYSDIEDAVDVEEDNISTGAITDYEEILATEIAAYGGENIKVARKSAQRKFQRTYQKSSIMNGRISKNGPEKGNNPAYVHEDFYDEFQRITGKNLTEDQVEKLSNHVRLVSVPSLRGSKKKGWHVVVPDKTGVLRVIQDAKNNKWVYRYNQVRWDENKRVKAREQAIVDEKEMMDKLSGPEDQTSADWMSP